MSNAYNILGVSESSSKEEIKKAYKKLAMKHHPDRDGGDPEKFQEISNAYDELTSDKPKFQEMGENDIFSHMFSGFHPFGGGNQRRENEFQNKKCVRKTIVISIIEAYTGVHKKLSINVDKKCSNCITVCNKCNGLGYVHKQVRQNMGFACVIQTIQLPCECNEGDIIKQDTCSKCNNKRKINENKIVNIHVEPGSLDGTEYKFDDIIQDSIIVFKLNINLPKNIKIESNNIILKHDIDFLDTFLGCKFTYIHPSGENICIDTFNHQEILKQDTPFVVKQKGMCKSKDLYVKFNIIYPKLVISSDKLTHKKEIKDLCNLHIIKK
jgi:DnaJ-class molecular chaperone